MVPSCPLCESYFGEYVAIPPYPRGGPSNKVFEYCQKKDHYRCFKVYYEQGFWYTHSVEEAVIWTVERELGEGLWLVVHCLLVCFGQQCDRLTIITTKSNFSVGTYLLHKYSAACVVSALVSTCSR